MDDTMMLKKTKERQEQHMQEVPKQQTMRAHLTELQKWDLAEGQTIEQRRDLQQDLLLRQAKEINESLLAKVGQAFPEAVAERVAAGAPIQAQQPAQLTFKERMEQQRKDRQARRKTPVADHVSVNMMESLKGKHKLENNSLNLLATQQLEQASADHVDTRVLRNFVHGYHAKRNGNPASPEDEAHKNADKRFLEDYCSRDINRRKPHLKRMLEQVLSINLTEDQFTTAYLEHHLAEVHAQVGQLIYFENVYKDPVNAPFFDELPQYTKDLIQHRVLNRYAPMGYVMTHTCALKAVDSDHLEYMTQVRTQSDLDIFAGLIGQERQILHDTLQETAAAEKEAVKQEFARRLEAEKKTLLKGSDGMKQQAETMEGDIGGLDLTSFVTGYSFDEMSKYRKMIEDHPDAYGQNPALIDALYQSMHHTMDVLGDLKLQTMAAQGVIDEIEATSAQKTVSDRLLIREANRALEDVQQKTDLLLVQLNSHTDALQALLRGKAFSDPAKLLLRQMGHPVE